VNLAEQQTNSSPAFSYHMLRNALNSFKKNLVQLNPAEYDQVFRSATKSFDIESLVIASKEAEGIVISEEQLNGSVSEVATRYENRDEFLKDLKNNGLDEEGLRSALYRELLFDGVMQRVAACAATVNELDINLFYEMHHERFQTPESRTARHILITINPDFPENKPQAALDRMNQLVEKLAGRINRFDDFARRYSECPTAMDGGRLGEVVRGQLYESLDAELFKLQERQISQILESDMGLHLLYCEKIKPAKRIPISKAAPRITEILQDRQRRNCQKSWLKSLQKKNCGVHND
jgi:peptidyl-prolyl cis-trans isomerase C